MISISADNASLNSIISDIKQLRDETGKSTMQGARWAGVTICKALGVQTKVSKKRRKIVSKVIVEGTKPVKGVMIFRYGKEEFYPIDTTRDIRVSHFKGRGGTPMVRFLKSRKVVTEKEYEAMTQLQISRNANAVFIRMSGLAKKSWFWINRKVNRGGYANDRFGGKSLNVGSVTWFGPNMTIHNRLSYAVDALKSGEQSVYVALENAAKSFAFKVNETLKKHGVQAT